MHLFLKLKILISFLQRRKFADVKNIMITPEHTKCSYPVCSGIFPFVYIRFNLVPLVYSNKIFNLNINTHLSIYLSICIYLSIYLSIYLYSIYCSIKKKQINILIHNVSWTNCHGPIFRWGLFSTLSIYLSSIYLSIYL